VNQEDDGVLVAMLSSLGTAAGTIGTTIVVALMEMDGERGYGLTLPCLPMLNNSLLDGRACRFSLSQCWVKLLSEE
jgi:hypothetical protein